ncbi:MAG: hypothetical protein AAB444_03475 [Patescibacteria group bacterium]
MRKTIFKIVARFWKEYGYDFTLRGLALILGTSLLFGSAAFYGALTTSPGQAATTSFSENFSSATYKNSSTTGVWHVDPDGGFGEISRNLTDGWISNSTLEVFDGLSTPTAKGVMLSPTFDWNPAVDCSVTPDACTMFVAGRGIWRSQNRGTSWTNISDGPAAADIPATLYLDVVISPTYTTDHALFVRGSGKGIYKTSDANVASPSWAQVDCAAGGSGCANASVRTFSLANDYNDDVGVCGASNCTILLGADDGAYYTINKGSTWVVYASVNAAHAGTDSIDQILASPNFSTDFGLYVLFEDDVIIQSVDGGTSWCTVTGLPAAPVLHMALSPDHNAGGTPDGAVFVTYKRAASATDDLYKSTAPAALCTVPAWSTIDVITGANIFQGVSIAFHPSYNEGVIGSQTMYLSTGTSGAGTYRSTNGGSGWTAIQGSSPNNINAVGPLEIAPNLYLGNPVAIVGSAADVNNRSGIFVASNADAATPSWSRISTGLKSLLFMDTAFSPNYLDDGTYFVADKQNGVFRTTDRGATFTRLATGLTLGGDIVGARSLMVSPTFDNDTTDCSGASAHKCTLFFFMDSGIFRSQDKGDTWTAINTGLDTDERAVAGIAISPNFSSDQTLFIGTTEETPYHDGQIFKSTNALGATPSWSLAHASNATIRAIVTSPSYTTDGAVFAVLGSASVLKSTDGGASWTTLTFTATPFNVALSPTFNDDAASCASADVCTAFVMEESSGNLWRTQTKGTANGDWTNVATVAGVGTPYGLAVSPTYATDKTVLLAGTQGARVSTNADAGSPTFTANNGELLSSGVFGTAVDAFSFIVSAAFSPGYATDGVAAVTSMISGFVNRFSAGGAATGTLRSSDIYTAGSTVLSATLTATATLNGQTSSYFITNDGGTTWNSVTSGTPYTFTTTGIDLRWRADLSTVDQTVTPRVTGIGISYTTPSGGSAPGLFPPKAPVYKDGSARGIDERMVAWRLENKANNETRLLLYAPNDTADPQEVIPQQESGGTLIEFDVIARDLAGPNTKAEGYTVVATNSGGRSSPTKLPTVYTLTYKPGLPEVKQEGLSEVKIVINPNRNPDDVEYALLDRIALQDAKWIDEKGGLVVNPVWQTYAKWGGANGQKISYLEQGVTYRFAVLARNNDKVERSSDDGQVFMLSTDFPKIGVTKTIVPDTGKTVASVKDMGGVVFASKMHRAAGGFALVFLALFMLAGKGMVDANGKISLRRVYGSILFGNPHTLFRSCAPRGECGTYRTSFSAFQSHHVFARRSVIAALAFALVKAVLAASVVFVGSAADVPTVLAETSATAFKPGDTVRYRVTASAIGQGTAQNVTVEDILDDRIEFVQGSVVGGATVFTPPNRLSITLGDIPTNSDSRSADFLVRVKSAASGIVTNQASVFSKNSSCIEKNCASGVVSFMVQAKQEPPIEPPEPPAPPIEIPKPVSLPVRLPSHIIQPSSGDGVGGGGGAGGGGDATSAVEIEIPTTDITYVTAEGESLTNNPAPAIRGKAYFLGGRSLPAGSKVNIRANGLSSGEALVGEDGAFTWRPEKNLEDAEYVFEATSDGATSLQVKVTVDTRIAAPRVSTANFQPDIPAVAVTRREGGKMSVPTRLEMNGTTDSDTSSLELRIVPAGFVGAAGPFGIRAANAASSPITETFVPHGPDWSYSTTVPLEIGDYQVSVVAKDFAGNLSLASNTVKFAVSIPQCADGVDNDDDGSTDFSDDTDCVSLLDNSEKTPIIAAIFSPQVKRVAKRYVTPGLLSVVLINFVLAINWASLLNLLQSFITQPIMLLERRKRKGWGIVYNALTKLPVDLATVRLFTAEGRLLQTRVTDKQGRYAFITGPGRYRLEVVKAGFVYPSIFLKDKKEDLDFLDLYHHEVIEVTEESTTIAANIPADPVEKMETPKEVFRRVTFRKFQRRMAAMGPVLSAVVIGISPSVVTIAPLAMHVALYFVFRRLSVGRRPKSWGIVYERETAEPMKFVIARVFENQYNKLLETQVTDGSGRYSFLVGRNVYYLVFEKAGYEPYKTSPVDLLKEGKEAFLGIDVRLSKRLAPPASTPAIQPPTQAPSSETTPEDQETKSSA